MKTISWQVREGTDSIWHVSEVLYGLVCEDKHYLSLLWFIIWWQFFWHNHLISVGFLVIWFGWFRMLAWVCYVFGMILFWCQLFLADTKEYCIYSWCFFFFFLNVYYFLLRQPLIGVRFGIQCVYSSHLIFGCSSSGSSMVPCLAAASQELLLLVALHLPDHADMSVLYLVHMLTAVLTDMYLYSGPSHCAAASLCIWASGHLHVLITLSVTVGRPCSSRLAIFCHLKGLIKKKGGGGSFNL